MVDQLILCALTVKLFEIKKCLFEKKKVMIHRCTIYNKNFYIERVTENVSHDENGKLRNATWNY